HFIKIFNAKTKRKVRGLSKEAMKVFINYDWPGNIRELENSLERLVVLSRNEIIQETELPDQLKQNVNARLSELGKSGALKDGMKEPEKKIILRALEEAGWNRKRAAHRLNINRTTLYNKMKEHSLL
ncbi:sigma-54-dependent Fis family transcriptional regulator, partial [Omnitrophica bacterium]|nr:sigma-54-dependent Fis family transcriptional regulator [Candidatus Omnitrophota bacterium]